MGAGELSQKSHSFDMAKYIHLGVLQKEHRDSVKP